MYSAVKANGTPGPPEYAGRSGCLCGRAGQAPDAATEDRRAHPAPLVWLTMNAWSTLGGPDLYSPPAPQLPAVAQDTE